MQIYNKFKDRNLKEDLMINRFIDQMLVQHKKKLRIFYTNKD